MCFGKKEKVTGDNDEATRRNAEIEKQLREDKKRQTREVKILLLGAGESGKSTILKQMKMIYAEGFSATDRKQWRMVIFSNLVHAFQVILSAMEEQDTDYDNPNNKQYTSLIQSDPEIDTSQPLPTDCLQAFKSLWADRSVQKAITRGNEYALHDNLSYYFQDIDRLFKRDFIPTDQDILRARLRTTGISETIFDLGQLTYKMFDVGGQRSERKKWIHVFDNVQVVLFLAAISGYDQVLVEDRNGNQMQEAFGLFEAISNSRWFEHSAMILFLNKIDLFREKIESGKAPIGNFYPDYQGGPYDVAAGQAFFADRFRSYVRQPNKETYVHFTNATDTDLLKKTMASVQDMIIQRNLNNLIL